MPTSRSTTFACTLSIQSLRLFPALCIPPALVRPSRRAPAPAPALRVDPIPVVCSMSQLLSTCLFYCLLAPSPFLFKVVGRRRRTSRVYPPQTFFWTLFTLFYTCLPTNLRQEHPLVDFCTRARCWLKLRTSGDPDPRTDDGLGDPNIRSGFPCTSRNVSPVMSVLPQTPSDVTPVVVDATVLSTKVRTVLHNECEDVYLIMALCHKVIPGEKPEEKEKWIHLVFTWSGKNFTLDIAESDRSVCSTHIMGAVGSGADTRLFLA